VRNLHGEKPKKANRSTQGTSQRKFFGTSARGEKKERNRCAIGKNRSSKRRNRRECKKERADPPQTEARRRKPEPRKAIISLRKNAPMAKSLREDARERRINKREIESQEKDHLVCPFNGEGGGFHPAALVGVPLGGGKALWAINPMIKGGRGKDG